LGKISWLAVILDEAQAIKNPDSQTARAACALDTGQRLALTGTPIENRLLDLWSIMAFTMPGVLGARARFARTYDQKDDPLARRRPTQAPGALPRQFQECAGPALSLHPLQPCGFALRLTAPSYVVLYDPWWNPAVENQATDRTHRIGQTSTVLAYRLIIKG